MTHSSKPPTVTSSPELHFETLTKIAVLKCGIFGKQSYKGLVESKRRKEECMNNVARTTGKAVHARAMLTLGVRLKVMEGIQHKGFQANTPRRL